MTPRQKKVSIFVGIVVVAAGLVAWLVVKALNQNGGINFAYTPSEVFDKKAPLGRSFRIGGLVTDHSLKRDKGGLTVHFQLTDTVRSIPVVFTGPLPDLFKEGKGAVVDGTLEPDGVFHATEVLAKHNEVYQAPEVKDSLKRAQAEKAAAAAAMTSSAK
jgi:cytochrome c-type biogenesis protein CcmE